MRGEIEFAQAGAALDRAKALGAADAEVMAERDAAFRVQMRRGEIETLSQAERAGIGVRVFTPDGRMGFAFSSDLDRDPASVAESAWDNAQSNDPDPWLALPDLAEETAQDWSEDDFQAIAVEDKIALALELEQRTRGAHACVSEVQRAAYADGHWEVLLVNSRGLSRRFRSASCSCSVMAQGEMNGSGAELEWEFDAARAFTALKPEWVADTCARNLARKLGGNPCPTAAMPVIVDRHVAGQFLSLLASGLKANNVLRGKSPYRDKLGESIAAACVNIVDQNDAPEGLSRAPFDGEGVPAQRTVLVEQGVARSFVHTLWTANRMGGASTANASRGGFRSTPEVGLTNCCIEPGERPPEALIAEAGNGLYLTDAMGVHTADPISGDFSFGAAGLLIEDGQLTRPVRGVTLAGNVRDMFLGILEVANDLRFVGSCSAPSLRVGELMVSGS